MAKKKTAKKTFRLTPTLRNETIAEVSGEDTLDIVEYLRGKENVSEFLIAKDLEQEINLIRNKLYRLLQANLIHFTRKKDKQKGWYIYYWTLNLGQTKFLYFDLKRKKLEGLRERLKREMQNFYFSCPNKCIRLDFEQAISFDYKCPECGELLNQEDNNQIIKQIESDIGSLENELGELGVKA